VQVSGASYAFDGVPYPDKLDLVAHGTFKCGIYVGESYELAKPHYSIILVAIYEDEDAPDIAYWVADGNPSMHGRGWAGTMPTNDFVSVNFKGAIDPANVEKANLTVVYLAGNRREPDYLEFNGYGIGGNDVANSGDGKTYGIDLKTFDVTKYIQSTASRRRWQPVRFTLTVS